MLEYYEILKKSYLFSGVDRSALEHILRCMEAHVCSYGKGEIIYHYGERISWAEIVLDGKVALVAPGKDGEESHIRLVGPSESFGCSNSCLAEQPALMMVMAKKKTKLLFVNLSKLFRREALGCAYAGLVTVNLLKQTAAENLTQSRRIHPRQTKAYAGTVFHRWKKCRAFDESAGTCGLSGGRAQRTVPRDGAHEKRGTDRLPEK